MREINEQPFEYLNNEDLRRFEARQNEQLVGFCEYQLRGTTLILPHTETLPAWQGRGIAAKLVSFVLDEARSRHLMVMPACWFVEEFIEEHREYRDLIATE